MPCFLFELLFQRGDGRVVSLRSAEHQATKDAWMEAAMADAQQAPARLYAKLHEGEERILAAKWGVGLCGLMVYSLHGALSQAWAGHPSIAWWLKNGRPPDAPPYWFIVGVGGAAVAGLAWSLWILLAALVDGGRSAVSTDR